MYNEENVLVQGFINCNFASENKNKLVIQGINNIYK